MHLSQGAIINFLMQSLMGETNASRLRRDGPLDGSCYKSGNPPTAVAYRPPLRVYRLQLWLPKTALHRYFKPLTSGMGSIQNKQRITDYLFFKIQPPLYPPKGGNPKLIDAVVY